MAETLARRRAYAEASGGWLEYQRLGFAPCPRVRQPTGWARHVISVAANIRALEVHGLHDRLGCYDHGVSERILIEPRLCSYWADGGLIDAKS